MAIPVRATATEEKLMTGDLVKAARWASVALPGISTANGEAKFGFQTPQTPVAHQIYDLHLIVLGIGVVIAVVVFAFMFYAIVRHRRSVGHQAKQFDDNKPVQVLWTLIPCLIVAGMAWPATRTVIAMKDTSSPDLTIKVTGYQWKWRYDYLGEDVSFYSDLSTPREQIENKAPKGDELPSRGGQPTGRSGGQEGAHPRHRERRDPFVVGACLRRQAGRDTRVRARLVVQGRHAGHLSWPVRGIVRQGARLHAHRRRGASRGPVRDVAGRAADQEQGCRRGCQRGGGKDVYAWTS